MRKHLDVLAVALVLPSALAAQADTVRAGVVFGTVYDSVARTPVAGALVQLAQASNPAAGVQSATTDQRGRYEIGGVGPGSYIAGFHHAALDSLALDVRVRAVEVLPGKRTRLDLAVPSPATIIAAVCGRSLAADSTGLLIGMLRDARTGLSLDTGTVQARWTEFLLDSSGFHQYNREVTSAVGHAGWYVLCGVPAGSDAAILGWQGPDSTGLVLASVPTGGLARRDLFVRGVAVVRGSVVSERGQPIANARIGVVGRERTATTDSAGKFHLGETPAGSQTLEFRALGYAPDLRLLHLSAGGDTTLAVMLTSMKKVLDTIRVVAQRLYDRDLNGFERRKRMGFGTFFDEETIRRRRPHDLFQLLWGVPSVRVSQTGFQRTVQMRGSFGPCTPELFVNGMRMPSDLLGDLDLFARPDETVAMEVYRGTQAPAQYSSFSGCGSIVVWTRPPSRRRR